MLEREVLDFFEFPGQRVVLLRPRFQQREHVILSTLGQLLFEAKFARNDKVEVPDWHMLLVNVCAAFHLYGAQLLAQPILEDLAGPGKPWNRADELILDEVSLLHDLLLAFFEVFEQNRAPGGGLERVFELFAGHSWSLHHIGEEGRRFCL